MPSPARLIALLCGILGLGCLHAAPPHSSIQPGELWPDDRGRHIQAHGGGILKEGDTYYWFGEDRSEDNVQGWRYVACYASRDLINWEFRNQVFKSADPENLGPRWVLERPKVFHNPRTGKYVMYMHIDGTPKGDGVGSAYALARVGVAVSDTIDGDYRYVRSFRPLGLQSRDIGQFIDDDGTPYLIFESRPTKGFYIAALSDDYLDVAREVCFIKSPLEGGALVHHEGLYYLIGSYMTGWDPNPNQYATARRLEGPWSEFKDIAPREAKTYGSQSTLMLKVAGSKKTSVLFLGDIWRPKAQHDSRYLWMPLEIGDGRLRLPPPREWTLDVKTGETRFLTPGAAPLLPAETPHAANPILPGYFADPSLVQYQDSNYLYATLDPWGGDTLGCWESRDFGNWVYRELNWPTKKACTSPTSQRAKVWAPSVVRARDGRFFMYVSVGSEVWAGVAAHPLGPWRNALGDRPLIPADYKPGFHMIDAEAFLDDDGQAYLYWGSGLNWTNGRCWAVKLKPDMVTFDGEVRDVTPANYFEGPFMVKHAGRYYLTYSQGRTTEESYQVRYAVGDTPFGPFTEAANSPILATDREAGVLSPGHHAVFTREGRDYILYHRHSIPFDPKFIGRQTCVDELRFTPDGLIEKVTPTHAGPAFLQGLRTKRVNLATTASASSQRTPRTTAACALDDNYATRWAPAADARGAWLQLDLGAVKDFSRQELRLEYPWKTYRFSIQTSLDGVAWKPFVPENSGTSPVGSPVFIDRPGRARHLRLVFPEAVKGEDISVFEWSVY